MHRPQSQHFSERKEHKTFVVESSDAIEELRVYVKEEGSDKVYWYKERFLTDDEIVENVVSQENATSRICWTVHRPKRGWYIRIRAPSFPPGVSIPLKPLPSSSPFHTDAALSLSTRINPPKRGGLLHPPSTASGSNARMASPSSQSGKSSMETVTTSSETVVHSYPPTPSPGAGGALVHPPSPGTVHAKLDQVQAVRKRQSGALVPMDIREFMLTPHSSPHVPQLENSSLITKALSMLKNHKPSHSLSFTLCPLPLPDDDPSSASSAPPQQPRASSKEHSKRHSLVRLDELVPPSLPPLITFHDRSPAWSMGSFTGILEIDTAMEREFGVDRGFWIAVALTYMEFLVERESYLAAARG